MFGILLLHTIVVLLGFFILGGGGGGGRGGGGREEFLQGPQPRVWDLGALHVSFELQCFYSSYNVRLFLENAHISSS